MPKQVIKDGEIINVRENMSRFFVNKNDNSQNKDEFSTYDITKKINENEKGKIKVHIQLLDKIIILNILKQDLLKSIYDMIMKIVNANSLAKIKMIDSYCLCTNFPFKEYEYSEKNTIEELGLNSNFLIFKEKSALISCK